MLIKNFTLHLHRRAGREVLTPILLQGIVPPPCRRRSCSSSCCAGLSRCFQTRTRRSWPSGRSGRAWTESPTTIWWDRSHLKHACVLTDPDAHWPWCVCIYCAGGCAEKVHLGREQAADWREQSGFFNGFQAFYYGHEQIRRHGENHSLVRR